MERQNPRKILGRTKVKTAPPHRFGAILRDAETVGITRPEVELTESVSLLRRQAKPADGFGVVLHHAQSVGISNAQVKRGELSRHVLCLSGVRGESEQ